MRRDLRGSRSLSPDGLVSRELTDVEEEIIQQVRQNRRGVHFIRKQLRKILDECQKTGTVSIEHRHMLSDCCGRKAILLLWPISKSPLTASTTPQQLEEFLAALRSEYEHVDSEARSLDQVAEIQLARLCIPLERSDLFIRYRAHNSRELNHALSELERRQRRKSGETVIPPIKLDITEGL